MKRRSTFVWSYVFLLFTLAILPNVASAAEPFILVSDVDDTVKITNVRDRDRAVWKAIASEAVFAGMPELYRQLLGAESQPERLRFISGSPSLLKHKIDELLTDSGFPLYKLTRRRVGETFRSPFDYKIKHMQDLYGSSKAAFLLIGDDTESDPEVYENFSASKPGQILAIYIHRITGRNLPVHSVPFVTAYDIAMREFFAGRLSEEQTAAVGNAVFASANGTFLPRFQDCPNELEKILDQPQPLVDLQTKIENRLRELCGRRTSIKEGSR